MLLHSLLVFLVAIQPKLVQVLVVINRVLPSLLPFLVDSGKFLDTVLFLLLHELLVPFHIGIVASLLQYELGTLFHSYLNSVFSGLFDFLHSIMLFLQYLFSLDYLSTAILQQECLYSVVRVDGVLRLEHAPVGSGTRVYGHVAARGFVHDGAVRVKGVRRG